jgi:putative transposase
MALDQSALLEVLEALKVAVGDRVRQAAETIYQALIEAELTAAIGAAPGERTDTLRGAFAQRRGNRHPGGRDTASRAVARGRVR